MSLTAYEAGRLKKLAQKAGIKLRVPKARTIKLTRPEKASIEQGLEKNGVVVVTKRNGGRARVWSIKGYRRVGENMANYHKSRRNGGKNAKA